MEESLERRESWIISSFFYMEMIFILVAGKPFFYQAPALLKGRKKDK